VGERLDLGVGVVAHAGLDLMWPQVGGLIDVVEVEPQTVWLEVPGGWEPDPRAMDWLEQLPVPRLAHGVGFPVGGQVAPDPRGVTLFADCCRRLDVRHASEHLSFNCTQLGDEMQHAGFLLPPRQNWETIEAAAAHIATYQRAVDRPFLVETGVSYVAPGDDELLDGDFLRELSERADCGILLDLHNVWANEHNGRQPVQELLASLPLERVLEVHVAGGFEFGGYYLDAHSGACDDELVDLLSRTLPLLPEVRAVVFEAMPLYLVDMGATGVRRELERLHRVVDSCGRPRRRGRLPAPKQGRAPAQPRVPEEVWQREVIAYTTRGSTTAPCPDAGFDVLRELTDAARLGRVGVAARDVITDLAEEIGMEGVDSLARQYLVDCDAQLWTTAEAAEFCRWLRELATV